MGTEPISFGPFVLDRGNATLLADGKPVAIGQRGYALLAALAAADGPVTKAGLIEAAWPGTIVEEGNLTVQIAALRKSLGTRRDGQEWIVTVPRLGYRLLRDAASEREPEPEEELPSIAVLPFQNLSADPEQDYFADGIVEEIITALSRFRRFRVVARSSSFIFKNRTIDLREAARTLSARYLVEGSVRRAGQKLRVTAQLIDGESGDHLWARSFDGPLEDVFEMQDRITESVAALIEPRIQRAEIERARRFRPGSFTAYDLFLQAAAMADMVNPADSIRAIDLLERAIALEPDHAPALALFANVLEHRSTMGWPGAGADDIDRALGMVKRALDLTGDDAEVLCRCGLMLIQLGRDYGAGIAVLQRAVAVNPTLPLALEHLGIGYMWADRYDEAEEMLRRAKRMTLDDANRITTGLAHVAFCQGRYEEALELAMQSLGVNAYFNPTHWLLIAANVRLGRMEEARRRLANLLEAVPGLSFERLRRMHIPASSMTGIFEAMKLAGLPDG